MEQHVERKIYLMRMGEFVKIGVSANPHARSGHFETLPLSMEVIHIIESENAGLVERALHRRFKDVQVNGEWFRLAAADIDLIRSVIRCDSPDDLPQVLKPLFGPGGKNGAAWVRSRKLKAVLVSMPLEVHAKIKRASVCSGLSMVAWAVQVLDAEATKVLREQDKVSIERDK